MVVLLNSFPAPMIMMCDQYTYNLLVRTRTSCGIPTQLFPSQSSNTHNRAKADLIAFNRCRIYLQVNSLAEISTADGRSINRSAWQGNRLTTPQHLWPQQEKSGPNHGRFGASASQRNFLTTKKANVEYTLRQRT
jgi:hypothetical protein